MSALGGNPRASWSSFDTDAAWSQLSSSETDGSTMAVYAVHISDLHIGRDLSGSVAAQGAQRLVPLAAGHDPVALNALSVFLTAFHTAHPHDNTVLIISGDVSANGDKSELALYKTLLHLGFVKNNWKTLLPLRNGFRQVLEVPGNHDVWDGVTHPSPAALRQARLDFFSVWTAHGPQLQSLLEVPMGQHRIVFHALCSTSGCTPGEQMLGLGAFAPNDVADLEQAVRRYDNQHRPAFAHHFIVLHHSRADQTPRHHRLTDQAKAILQRLGGGAH